MIVALAGCGRSGADSADTQRCRELGDGNLRGSGVTVHLASGRVPACAAHAAATRAFVAASEAFDKIPRGARPERAAKFDPHPLGHALAAELWKRRLQLEDLVICMQAPAGWGDSDAPRAVLGAWLSGCPKRSRATIRKALAAWAPAPMLPAEGEAHVEEEADVVR